MSDEMAAPTIYSCPADFPPKIPIILAAEGLSARYDEQRFPRLTARESGFAYRIADDRCVVDVAGLKEKDGTVAFYVTGRGCWNPFVRRRSRQFQDRVAAVLLREGAHVVTHEEIEAYEKNRKADQTPSRPSGGSS